MTFVLVPSGEFMMGSIESPDSLAKVYPQYEEERLQALADEAPVHRVRITRPFYLGQYEVTVGQFRRFLEASGYRPESEVDGTGGHGYNPNYDPRASARGDTFEGRSPRYSWYGEDYYSESPVDDPKGPESGSVRVRRGGSWHTWSFYARSSYRNWNTPQTRYPLVGFRLVREVDANEH